MSSLYRIDDTSHISSFYINKLFSLSSALHSYVHIQYENKLKWTMERKGRIWSSSDMKYLYNVKYNGGMNMKYN